MINLPSFQSYGDYTSDNYGVNALQFYMPGLTLWYSYRTIVAFWTPSTGKVISENIWGPTTGKHLNWINDDHSVRVDRETFENTLEEALHRMTTGQ